MTEENSFLIPITGLLPVREGAFKGHLWADPSVRCSPPGSPSVRWASIFITVSLQRPEEAISARCRGSATRSHVMVELEHDLTGTATARSNVSTPDTGGRS
jgi:hypothetical protein